MRYVALATDYDGTLASHGVVDEATIEALRRLSASGRKLVMVTGRQCDDLLAIFPEAATFNRIVAENGAVIYRPDTRETRLLADAPSPKFVDELKRRKVEPLSVGLVVVASEQPAETAIIEVIRDLGLELEVIFNKGSIMVLPPSVNKATGLKAALDELQLSPNNVVGVGDAENDLAFLEICGCSVAVANALDSVKERADYVVEGRASAGVRELIERLLADEMAAVSLDPPPRPGWRSEITTAQFGPMAEDLLAVSLEAAASGSATIARPIVDRGVDLYLRSSVTPHGPRPGEGVSASESRRQREPRPPGQRDQ